MIAKSVAITGEAYLLFEDWSTEDRTGSARTIGIAMGISTFIF